MTGKEAYKILSKDFPAMKVRSCLDFGSFFAFCLAPLYVSDDEDYMTGTCLDAVDKSNGRVFVYDITSNAEAYLNVKEVDIKTIYDENV